MKRPDVPKSDQGAIGTGYTLLSIGITFALVLAGAVLLGLWIDRRLGSVPLFTIVGAFVGMGLGGMWMYLRLRRGVQGRSDGK